MHPFQRMRSIFYHHQLLLAFVQKEFYSRYAGSALGILWTQFYPILLLAIFYFVFSVVFAVDIPRFPLFLFIGIIIWNFFNSSILLSTTSFLANATIVTKVAFPRELIPISMIIVALIDLILSHLVVALAAVVYKVQPSWSWFSIPFLLVFLAIFCLGAGLMVSTVVVYLRDVRFFVEVGMMLLMFVSAIFYSVDMVPEPYRSVMNMNPLTLVVTAYRGAFLEASWPSVFTWIYLIIISFNMLYVGYVIFIKGQRHFADVL